MPRDALNRDMEEGVERMEFLRAEQQQAAEQFSDKKQVWINDKDHGFAKASIIKDDGENVLVQNTVTMQEITVKKEDIQQINPPKFEKLEDMANLTYLNEASVLHNLRQRYFSSMIYTYSGIFCVAVNPYARLPIYTKEVINSYRGKRRTEMPPHIYTVADESYQTMIQQRENQSILITGESGAGKTENTKKVVSYFASVCGVGDQVGQSNSDPESPEGKTTLDQALVRCNPVLEAFGNAKTLKNDNSSRFGKFIRIHFGGTGKIHSADIERYLLEKARVTYQNPDERSFHIFYQMLKGMNADELKDCLLTNSPNNYAVLSNGDVIVDSLADPDLFLETQQCMGVLNFSKELQRKIFRFAAGVLHLGNTQLKSNKRDEGCTIDDAQWIDKACHMFGVNAVEMTKALIKPRIKVGNEYVHKGQNAEQVKYSINALCKSVFEKLFKLVLDMCNETLETKLRKNFFIGVLDIAGFEIFEFNSFEQLCINLTNEKIQQFFNHHMFTLEQEEYRKEGIKWDFIDFGLDLEPTIELIEKNMGVFAVMDEECIMPKASDQTFLSKLTLCHNNKHPKFLKPSAKSSMGINPVHFQVIHYAGVVGYNVDGWLDKNKDPLNENVVELFVKSKDPVFSKLFEAPEVAHTGRGRKKGGSFQTVAMIHKQAVEHLLNTLQQTTPHFIRCILPNMKKKSGIIEAKLVLEQLRCNGVLEGIRIVRKGFPNRLLYQEFVQRYTILAPKAIPAGFVDGMKATEKLVEALNLEENEFRMGYSKIFLRAGVIGSLEDKRDERVKEVLIGFQTLARGWLARKRFRKLLDLRVGVLVAQRNTRQYFILRKWQWWRLFTKVKPLLSVTRQEEEFKEKEKEIERARIQAEEFKVHTDDLQARLDAALTENGKVKDTLTKEQQAAIEAEEQCTKLESMKSKLEDEVSGLMDQIDEEQDNNFKISAQKRALEAELSDVKSNIEILESSIKTKDADLHRKDEALTAKEGECAKKDEEMRRLADKQKSLEAAITDLEVSLASASEKAASLDRAKKKADTEVKRLTEELDNERLNKATLDKNLRTKETELKDTVAKLEDISNAKALCEAELKKREAELAQSNQLLEEEQEAGQKKDRNAKDLNNKIHDLEEELEGEKAAKARVERQCKELDRELQDLNERLEEAGGATAAQIDVNRRREEEIQNLKNELENSEREHGEAVDGLKKKLNETQLMLEESQELAKKTKLKNDKDRAAAKGEFDALSEAHDNLQKQKSALEKTARTLDEQLGDSNSRCATMETNLRDLADKYNKLVKENNELCARIEDMEVKEVNLNRSKKGLQNQIDELNSQIEVVTSEKNGLANQLKQAASEIDNLQEELEMSISEREDKERMLGLAQNELIAVKGVCESEHVPRIEELETENRKLQLKIAELEDTVDEVQTKANQADKTRQRLTLELEDTTIELDRVKNDLGSMEKKQRKVDQLVSEWKAKYDQETTKNEGLVREIQKINTDSMNMKNSNTELQDELDNVKRQMKSLQGENADLIEQLEGGGKATHEIEKLRRKLEAENEELRNQLEEAETLLTMEENKTSKLTLELSQLKMEMEKRLGEKDEETDKDRKNLLRQIDSLHQSIEDETKIKNDLMKARKMADTEVAGLHDDLDNAEKTIGTLNSNLGKQQKAINELQTALEDSNKNGENLKTALIKSDKKASTLANEKSDLEAAVERVERLLKSMENEKAELTGQVANLETQRNSVESSRKKLDAECHQLRDSIEDLEEEKRTADTMTQRANEALHRTQSELAVEQEAKSNQERACQTLTRRIVELESQLEDLEQQARNAGKSKIAALQNKVRQSEADLDNESKRRMDAEKAVKKLERVIKENAFNAEEDHKTIQRQQATLDMNNTKIKTLKRNMDDSETQVSQLQSKLRKAQAELAEAEERADLAESSLSRAAGRNRAAAGRVARTEYVPRNSRNKQEDEEEE
ncbi:myosin heavy chain, striated muscle-like isoform X4 [Bolinopsis microptera]|uniref:myosin heavy chain, striated muscle-like isoform X4 n=2 Tax=Bolinopsis microptera TaxID=2820187 RepID=UPI00307A153A